MDKDSDSDSLPDLNEIFAPPPTTISPGDIVWAKFKKLYWPALVRAVYSHQKKISIWYCDDPGKTFKLPLKNVCLFHDSEKYSQILKDVKEAGCLKEHEGLKSHATSYLIRKAEGYKDDPSKFFDQTYPFYFVEEMLKKDPTADVSDIKIRPMYISNEKKQTLRQRISACNNESDDSELESEDSDCEIKNCKTSDYVSDVNKQLQENLSDSFKLDEVAIDEIIEYILSGQADDYLQLIKSKKIDSQHRDVFEESVKNKKRTISALTLTGPINDDNKWRKLVFYLLPLYKKFGKAAMNKRKSPRKSKVSVLSSDCDESSIDFQYVGSVFLPESIIFALSKIKNIPLSDARYLFIDYGTETSENLKHVDSGFHENDTGICASDSAGKKCLQNKEGHGTLKHKSSADDDVCSQVKKMRLDKLDVQGEKEFLKTCKDLEVCNEVKLKETSCSKVDSSEEGCVNKILNLILSGKADDYLKKIKLNNVSSNYFEIYEKAVKASKKMLGNITYTGPLKDNSEVKKLVQYLLSFYNNVNDSHKSQRSAAKRCKAAMATYYVSENNPAVLYVLYVWLPESIIFALSEIENIALPDAKKLFDEYAEVKSVPDILKILEQDY